MPKIIAIVQARMGSSRFPGKVLKDICGKPLLEHLINRVKMSSVINLILIATTTEEEDGPIINLAKRLNVRVYRGSQDDVLDRYLKAAEDVKADVIVRITGDSPLVEPRFLDIAVRHHLRKKIDLTCAKNKDQIPSGTGCEVISYSALRQAWEWGHSPQDREHVTWYILSHPEKFKIEFIRVKKALRLPRICLTVDEEADLELIRQIFTRLYFKNPLFTLSEIIELYKKEPNLFKINAHVQRKPNLWEKKAIMK